MNVDRLTAAELPLTTMSFIQNTLVTKKTKLLIQREGSIILYVLEVVVNKSHVPHV